MSVREYQSNVSSTPQAGRSKTSERLLFEGLDLMRTRSAVHAFPGTIYVLRLYLAQITTTATATCSHLVDLRGGTALSQKDEGAYRMSLGNTHSHNV